MVTGETRALEEVVLFKALRESRNQPAFRTHIGGALQLSLDPISERYLSREQLEVGQMLPRLQIIVLELLIPAAQNVELASQRIVVRHLPAHPHVAGYESK